MNPQVISCPQGAQDEQWELIPNLNYRLEGLNSRRALVSSWLENSRVAGHAGKHQVRIPTGNSAYDGALQEVAWEERLWWH